MNADYLALLESENNRDAVLSGVTPIEGGNEKLLRYAERQADVHIARTVFGAWTVDLQTLWDKLERPTFKIEKIETVQHDGRTCLRFEWSDQHNARVSEEGRVFDDIIYQQNAYVLLDLESDLNVLEYHFEIPKSSAVIHCHNEYGLTVSGIRFCKSLTEVRGGGRGPRSDAVYNVIANEITPLQSTPGLFTLTSIGLPEPNLDALRLNDGPGFYRKGRIVAPTILAILLFGTAYVIKRRRRNNEVD